MGLTYILNHTGAQVDDAVDKATKVVANPTLSGGETTLTGLLVDQTNYKVASGTITGITMNGQSVGTSGIVDLGSIIIESDVRIDDANKWLTSGYIKTRNQSEEYETATANLPAVCTGSDRWGVLLYIAENTSNHAGLQQYFPIDGTYKGRIFYRSVTGYSAGIDPEFGEWNLVPWTSAIPSKTSQLTNDSGFLTSHQDISGKENTSNKVTSISSSSTDIQYPSAKCVYDEVSTKIDDVKQNGTSIVSNNVANITLETSLGNDSTNSATVTAIRAFVNSSIQASAAYYITADTSGNAFATKAALIAGPWYYGGISRTVITNDYAIVLADEDHSGKTSRYSYQSNQWTFQYTVNTTFTQAQLDAMNSGVTSSKISNYDSHIANTNNPHSVTKAQLGLGNVDNTSDATKKTNFTGSIASGNTGFVAGGDLYTALSTKVNTSDTVEAETLNTTTISTVTIDTTPTAGSTNLVTSGGVYSALQSGAHLYRHSVMFDNTDQGYSFTIAFVSTSATSVTSTSFSSSSGFTTLYNTVVGWLSVPKVTNYSGDDHYPIGTGFTSGGTYYTYDATESTPYQSHSVTDWIGSYVSVSDIVTQLF